MGSTTTSISGVPSDITGLRDQLIKGMMGGQYSTPSLNPQYTQNPFFQASTQTREQAMGTSPLTTGTGTGGGGSQVVPWTGTPPVSNSPVGPGYTGGGTVYSAGAGTGAPPAGWGSTPATSSPTGPYGSWTNPTGQPQTTPVGQIPAGTPYWPTAPLVPNPAGGNMTPQGTTSNQFLGYVSPQGGTFGGAFADKGAAAPLWGAVANGDPKALYAAMNSADPALQQVAAEYIARGLNSSGTQGPTADLLHALSPQAQTMVQNVFLGATGGYAADQAGFDPNRAANAPAYAAAWDRLAGPTYQKEQRTNQVLQATMIPGVGSATVQGDGQILWQGQVIGNINDPAFDPAKLSAAVNGLANTDYQQKLALYNQQLASYDQQMSNYQQPSNSEITSGATGTSGATATPGGYTTTPATAQPSASSYRKEGSYPGLGYTVDAKGIAYDMTTGTSLSGSEVNSRIQYYMANPGATADAVSRGTTAQAKSYPDYGYVIDKNGIAYDLTTGQSLSSQEVQRRNALGAGYKTSVAQQDSSTNKMFSQMLAGLIAGPQGGAIASLPGLDVAKLQQVMGPQGAQIAPVGQMTAAQIAPTSGNGIQTTQQLLQMLQQFGSGGPNSFQGAQINPVAPMQGTQVQSVEGPQAAQVQMSPELQALLGGASASALGDMATTAGGVANQTSIGSVLGTQQSADQIAAQNSPYMQNLMQAYNTQADQNYSLALAQAKESAGNLTGSGFANQLGVVADRSIADRNAKFADLLQNMTAQEMQRQSGQSGLEQGRLTAQAEMNAQQMQQAQALALQAVQTGRKDLMEIATTLYNKAQTDTANQQQTGLAQYQGNLGQASQQAQLNAAQQQTQYQTQADLAAKQAQLRQEAGMAGQTTQSNLALQAAQLGQQGALAQYQTQADTARSQAQLQQEAQLQQFLTQASQNQQQAQLNQQATLAGYQGQLGQSQLQGQMTQQANTDYFNAGVARNQTQAGLTQANQLAQFNAANTTNDANAQRLMQLLTALTTAGVGQNTPVTSGGAGAAAPGILQLLTTLFGK